MQTKILLAALNQTLSQGLPILDADRLKVGRLSLNLRNALNHSTIESGRSVLPRDLETATNFVEIVAKWVCNYTSTWLSGIIHTPTCTLSQIDVYTFLSILKYSLSKDNSLFDDNEKETEEGHQKKVHSISVLVNETRSFSIYNCTCALQVMADIVSSLLDEKNTPAFDATHKVPYITKFLWPKYFLNCLQKRGQKCSL